VALFWKVKVITKLLSKNGVIDGWLALAKEFSILNLGPKEPSVESNLTLPKCLTSDACKCHVRFLRLIAYAFLSALTLPSLAPRLLQVAAT
jgi:hypothetical protein